LSFGGRIFCGEPVAASPENAQKKQSGRGRLSAAPVPPSETSLQYAAQSRFDWFGPTL